MYHKSWKPYDSTKLLSLFLVLFLHSPLFVTISLYTKPPEEIVAVKLVNKLSVVEESKLPPSTKGTGNQQYRTDTKLCEGRDEDYKGTGFMINPGSGHIYNIPEFYPAYKAGIREGDILVDVVDNEDDYVTMVVRRGTVVSMYRIKKEKICYKGKHDVGATDGKTHLPGG